MPITAQTQIQDIVFHYPAAADHLVNNYNFHCVSCILAGYETLEQGALVHGIYGESLEKLVNDLNSIRSQSSRDSVREPGARNQESAKQPEIQQPLLLVDLRSIYLTGPGIESYQDLLNAVAPQVDNRLTALQLFNSLIDRYYKGELSQKKLWQEFATRLSLKIDDNRNWIGEHFQPQIREGLSLGIEKDQLLAIGDFGPEQISVLKDKKLLQDFTYSYFSFELKLNLADPKFFEYVLAIENVSPKQLQVLSKDQKINHSASSAGCSVILPNSATSAPQL